MGFWKRQLEQELEDNSIKELLVYMIDNGKLKHPVEEGVSKYIISNGTSRLSEKQRNVLDFILSRYDKDIRCARCGEVVPTGELPSYEENGYCGYCQHMWEKVMEE